MGRTAWLQDRRVQKFRDVSSRWKPAVLSMTEAGELLGMSARQFEIGPASPEAAYVAPSRVGGVPDQRIAASCQERSGAQAPQDHRRSCPRRKVAGRRG